MIVSFWEKQNLCFKVYNEIIPAYISENFTLRNNVNDTNPRTKHFKQSKGVWYGTVCQMKLKVPKPRKHIITGVWNAGNCLNYKACL